MRELKFRAWDKDKKQMREVTGINWYDEYLWVDETPMSGDKLPIEGTPLMQYTGLLDKNDKEIYEGDIVHLWNQYSDRIVPSSTATYGIRTYEKGIYEVYYRGDRWHLRSGDEDYDNGDYHQGDEVEWGDNKTSFLEVIGNIYENPELLK